MAPAPRREATFSFQQQHLIFRPSSLPAAPPIPKPHLPEQAGSWINPASSGAENLPCRVASKGEGQTGSIAPQRDGLRGEGKVPADFAFFFASSNFLAALLVLGILTHCKEGRGGRVWMLGSPAAFPVLRWSSPRVPLFWQCWGCIGTCVAGLCPGLAEPSSV
ncbi:hypothetical protein VUR80DRAFT_9946 [Thermomyces stellatus]